MKTLSIALICVVAPLAAVGWRLHGDEATLRDFLPERLYEVELIQSLDGHGEPVSLTTYLPVSDARQEILSETHRNADLVLEVERRGEDRIARWSAPQVQGHRTVSYAAQVRAHTVRYQLPEGAPIPGDVPPPLRAYLESTPEVQADNQEIGEALAAVAPEGTDLADTLRAIFETTSGLRAVDFKGTTDALTALRLGESSCNGKSRLFVAMARRAGIPTRLVGGVILRQGTKRTSHQWVEAWVQGYWVPFCPTNGHFAELPGNYLVLYHGDETLFRHTAEVNFDYAFKIRRRLVSPRELLSPGAAGPLDVAGAFARIGVPLGLLKIVLLLPVGFLVAVVFRHVVGVETLGLFLPVLIAAAARETGLGWGTLGVVMVLLLVGALRFALEPLKLLRLPKMGILLTMVVGVLLLLTMAAVGAGFLELAHVSLFPLAILTITVERVVTSLLEEGLVTTVKLVGGTLAVVAVCYPVLASVTLQSLFLAFPELLLAVVGFQLALGKWIGIRLSEHLRFRSLLFRSTGGAA